MVADQGSAPAGPHGGLYANELFEEDRGDVTIFVPLADPPDQVGRARRLEIPGGSFAVAVHEGSHDDADRTYGAVGTYALEHGLDRPGRVREWYLVGRHDTGDTDAWRTEIGWPITTVAG